MSNLNHNIDVGANSLKSKVRVFANQGLNDQKEWVFKRQFKIGRHRTTDVCIKDPTVSRYHALVYLDKENWLIQDMNSSNGTFIDGKRVTEYPVPLKKQTKMQLGWNGPVLHLCTVDPNLSDTKTVMVDQGTIKKNNRRYSIIKSSCKKNNEGDDVTPVSMHNSRLDKPSLINFLKKVKMWPKKLRMATSIFMIVLLLAGYISVQEKQGSKESQNEIGIVEKQNDVERVRDFNINKADSQIGSKSILSNLQASVSKKPYRSNEPSDLEKNNAGDLQRLIIQNHTADIYFESAEKFSAHHRWQTALEYYQKILKIDSNYPHLNTKIAKVKFENDNQAIYEKAKAYIEEKRYEQGIAALGNFPKNSFYYQEVGNLIDEASKKQKQVEDERRRIEAERLKAEQEQKASDMIKEALENYAEGKTKSSINILNQVVEISYPGIPDLKKRADTLKNEIDDAMTLNSKGNQAYKSGQVEMALSAWSKLIKMDQKLLGNKQGYYSRSISQKIADEYGDRALKAYSTGDYPVSYQQSQMALHQNANHSKASKVSEMLQEKSKLLYQEGCMIEAFNAASAEEKWKLITEICDSDSTYYKLALNKMNKK